MGTMHSARLRNTSNTVYPPEDNFYRIVSFQGRELPQLQKKIKEKQSKITIPKYFF